MPSLISRSSPRGCRMRWSNWASWPMPEGGPSESWTREVDRRIRVLPLDQGVQAVLVRGEQGLDAVRAHVGHDDMTNLVVDVAEQAVRCHLLGLVAVVVGRADVVDRPDLVAVDQEQVVQRHEALLAQGTVEGVLVSDGEDVAPPAICDHGEDDVGDLLPACVGEGELQQLRARRVRPESDMQRAWDLVLFRPYR